MESTDNLFDDTSCGNVGMHKPECNCLPTLYSFDNETSAITPVFHKVKPVVFVVSLFEPHEGLEVHKIFQHLNDAKIYVKRYILGLKKSYRFVTSRADHRPNIYMYYFFKDLPEGSNDAYKHIFQIDQYEVEL